MRILFTTSTFPRWSNDTELPIVFNIAKNILKYHGKNIRIFVLAPHHHQAKTEETIENVKIYRFKYFVSKWEKLCYNGGIMPNIRKNKFLLFLIPFFIFSQILAIKKIVRKERVDLIHAHWLLPQGLSAILYKKLFNKKIKIVCTAHGADIFCLNNKFFNLLRYFILKNANLITAVSNNLGEEIKNFKIDACKVKIIHNAIDIDVFFKKSNYENIKLLKKDLNIISFCLLFVGRLCEKKGVKFLIEAMPKILSVFHKTKLLIIGNGPDYSYLKNKVKKSGLENNIYFLGKISNNQLPLYYNMTDILVLPSIVANNKDTEGLPVVLLESLACGLPVVATNVGGCSDVIKHNQTGILIPEQNSLSISRAVIKLLKNQKKMKEISDNGIILIKNNFNIKIISNNYYYLYEIILNIK